MIKNIKDLKNKNITIMGLGLNQGGLGITRFLAKAGAKLLVTDLKTEEELRPSLEKLKEFNIKYILGRHRKKDFVDTDIIIQNPAIPHNSKYLEFARKQKIPIKSDLDLFLNICPSQNIIAIAGTKGKSTVSHLIYKLFQKAQKKSVLAGNMGISVFDVLDKITPQTYIILEISSWQMEGIKDYKFRAKTAVLTNILPDHLDRYKDFESYAQAEKLIYKYQKSSDNLIINFDNKKTHSNKQKINSQIYWFSSKEKVNPGCYLKKDEMIFHSGEYKKSFAKIFELSLSGKHNLENILAACTVAFVHQIPVKVIYQVITNFSGIPYRLEMIREFKGIRFYNDTCATTPEATLASLQSLPRQPIILILGGKNKKLDYEIMTKTISKDKRIKKIILLQHSLYDASSIIFSFFKKQSGLEKVILAGDMQEAMKVAFKQAKIGDFVLLSPAAASFGMFKNEFDRGNQFNEAVMNLS
ncbi:MAG: UDP-N-acetylmuramoyl-L-alanine--D-glutamate ligase [Candidatus Caldatribacteriota bacterium]|nr:UDP-N-acetylmuramoyl-L-alanine--D-glutamate ligase [Candidatus Caldatribacteriota bacterium]